MSTKHSKPHSLHTRHGQHDRKQYTQTQCRRTYAQQHTRNKQFGNNITTNNIAQAQPQQQQNAQHNHKHTRININNVHHTKHT